MEDDVTVEITMETPEGASERKGLEVEGATDAGSALDAPKIGVTALPALEPTLVLSHVVDAESHVYTI